jgi:hypothetical protein
MKSAPFALLLLAGCTTTASDLRSKEPVHTFQTGKNPGTVAQCLAESISKIGSPSVIQGETETTITFVQQSATTLFITISKAGEGKVWRVNGLISYQGALRRCA